MATTTKKWHTATTTFSSKYTVQELDRFGSFTYLAAIAQLNDLKQCQQALLSELAEKNSQSQKALTNQITDTLSQELAAVQIQCQLLYAALVAKDDKKIQEALSKLQECANINSIKASLGKESSLNLPSLQALIHNHNEFVQQIKACQEYYTSTEPRERDAHEDAARAHEEVRYLTRSKAYAEEERKRNSKSAITATQESLMQRWGRESVEPRTSISPDHPEKKAVDQAEPSGTELHVRPKETDEVRFAKINDHMRATQATTKKIDIGGEGRFVNHNKKTDGSKEIDVFKRNSEFFSSKLSVQELMHDYARALALYKGEDGKPFLATQREFDLTYIMNKYCKKNQPKAPWKKKLELAEQYPIEAIDNMLSAFFNDKVDGSYHSCVYEHSVPNEGIKKKYDIYEFLKTVVGHPKAQVDALKEKYKELYKTAHEQRKESLTESRSFHLNVDSQQAVASSSTKLEKFKKLSIIDQADREAKLKSADLDLEDACYLLGEAIDRGETPLTPYVKRVQKELTERFGKLAPTRSAAQIACIMELRDQRNQPFYTPQQLLTILRHEEQAEADDRQLQILQHLDRNTASQEPVLVQVFESLVAESTETGVQEHQLPNTRRETLKKLFLQPFAGESALKNVTAMAHSCTLLLRAALKAGGLTEARLLINACVDKQLGKLSSEDQQEALFAMLNDTLNIEQLDKLFFDKSDGFIHLSDEYLQKVIDALGSKRFALLYNKATGSLTEPALKTHRENLQLEEQASLHSGESELKQLTAERVRDYYSKHHKIATPLSRTMLTHKQSLAVDSMVFYLAGSIMSQADFTKQHTLSEQSLSTLLSMSPPSANALYTDASLSDAIVKKHDGKVSEIVTASQSTNTTTQDVDNEMKLAAVTVLKLDTHEQKLKEILSAPSKAALAELPTQFSNIYEGIKQAMQKAEGDNFDKLGRQMQDAFDTARQQIGYLSGDIDDASKARYTQAINHTEATWYKAQLELQFKLGWKAAIGTLPSNANATVITKLLQAKSYHEAIQAIYDISIDPKDKTETIKHLKQTNRQAIAALLSPLTEQQCLDMFGMHSKEACASLIEYQASVDYGVAHCIDKLTSEGGDVDVDIPSQDARKAINRLAFKAVEACINHSAAIKANAAVNDQLKGKLEQLQHAAMTDSEFMDNQSFNKLCKDLELKGKSDAHEDANAILKQAINLYWDKQQKLVKIIKDKAENPEHLKQALQQEGGRYVFLFSDDEEPYYSASALSELQATLCGNVKREAMLSVSQAEQQTYVVALFKSKKTAQALAFLDELVTSGKPLRAKQLWDTLTSEQQQACFKQATDPTQARTLAQLMVASYEHAMVGKDGGEESHQNAMVGKDGDEESRQSAINTMVSLYNNIPEDKRPQLNTELHSALFDASHEIFARYVNQIDENDDKGYLVETLTNKSSKKIAELLTTQVNLQADFCAKTIQKLDQKQPGRAYEILHELENKDTDRHEAVKKAVLNLKGSEKLMLGNARELAKNFQTEITKKNFDIAVSMLNHSVVQQAEESKANSFQCLVQLLDSDDTEKQTEIFNRLPHDLQIKYFKCPGVGEDTENVTNRRQNLLVAAGNKPKLVCELLESLNKEKAAAKLFAGAKGQLGDDFKTIVEYMLTNKEQHSLLRTVFTEKFDSVKDYAKELMEKNENKSVAQEFLKELKGDEVRNKLKDALGDSLWKELAPPETPTPTRKS